MMDELDLIRSAYPKQPGPSPDVIRQARRRLEVLASEDTARGREPRRASWLAFARSGRLGIAFTTGTAAVACAALVLALGSAPEQSSGGGSDIPTSSPGTTLSAASQVLLTAAIRQESNEKATGRFFRVRSLFTNSPYVVGPATNRYRVKEPEIWESWTPADPADTGWFGSRELGARPATAADKSKWQRDGAPTSWKVPYEVARVRMAVGPAHLHRVTDRASKVYYLAGMTLTASQVQALPGDPAALRATLAQSLEPGTSEAERRQAVSYGAAELLFDVPATPKVRGAALRILAELPGVRLRTAVADPIGRVGTELSFTGELGRPAIPGGDRSTGTVRLVIDPSTGRLLSRSFHAPQLARTETVTVVLESGWTNETPRPPSAKVR